MLIKVRLKFVEGDYNHCTFFYILASVELIDHDLHISISFSISEESKIMTLLCKLSWPYNDQQGFRNC